MLFETFPKSNRLYAGKSEHHFLFDWDDCGRVVDLFQWSSVIVSFDNISPEKFQNDSLYCSSIINLSCWLFYELFNTI